MKFQSTRSSGKSRITMIIYGAPGIGKTTLAGTIDESLLIVSAESGTLPLADKDIKLFDVTQDDDGNKLNTATAKMERIQLVANYLLTEEAKTTLRWVVLDSMTEIGQLVFESIKESDPKFKDAKNNLILWGLYGEKMRAFVKFFRDLPSYNIVFTALAKSEKDELNRRIMAIDLQGKISEQLPGYFDEVFFYEMAELEDNQKVRRLVTQSSDRFVAKDRSGKLSQYEEPNLSAIARKIRGIDV